MVYKMTKITALKALEDNYVWAIHGTDASHIIVIDPGEASPVLTYLKENNLTLDGILLTHHHWDHTNGVKILVKHFPNIPVYGSETDKVKGITKFIKEGDEIIFENLNSPIQILEIPGHTLGHVAYIYDNALFCGDTLFSAGMGKIFEGTAAQMHHSLEKLKKLPSDTLIYCAHEYTLANIKFAQMIDPKNKVLENRKLEVENLRKNHLPSLPVPLSTELQTNPFLRCEDADVLNALQERGYTQNDPIDALLFLRELKNKF